MSWERELRCRVCGTRDVEPRRTFGCHHNAAVCELCDDLNNNLRCEKCAAMEHEVKDPRNEREAYSHLQRQADLDYRRNEMHRVQKAYKGGRPWQQWAAAGFLFAVLVAVTVLPAILFFRSL